MVLYLNVGSLIPDAVEYFSLSAPTLEVKCILTSIKDLEIGLDSMELLGKILPKCIKNILIYFHVLSHEFF